MFYNLWFSPCGSFSIESLYLETVESVSAEQSVIQYGKRVYGARLLRTGEYANFTHYPSTNWIGARDGITKAVPVNECLSCPSFSCLKK